MTRKTKGSYHNLAMEITKGGLKTPVAARQPEERVTRPRRAKNRVFIWSEDRCTACAKCAQRCPVDAITIRRQPTVSKREGMAPCSQACPAGIDVPRYLRFITEGKFPEAVAVIREKIPFPSVCGYVCPHPCQTRCQRGQLDEPILIRILKRFAAERDTGLWKLNSKVAPPTGRRVAIVGSGPAGLTAAYYLAKLGHSVTVFEALPEPGGMMWLGIPDYRLPGDVLTAEIKEIENIGVEIKTNSKVKSLDELLGQGYDAVLLAIGTHQGTKLPIPGADLDGVLTGTSFLRDVSLGKEVKLGSRVVVLGGGNVAFDCARTALRLGAKDVHMVFLESRGEMEAMPEEIEDGLGEGIALHPSRTFTRIVSGNGHVKGVECLKVRSFGFDSEGEVKIETIAGSERILPADIVIFAVGRVPELGLIDGVGNIRTNRHTIEVDSATLATGNDGVFAAGDAVVGPSSVIEAIAAGRKAAISIDKYLGGTGVIEETLAPPEGEVTPLGEAQGGGQPKVPKLSPGERLKGFDEVELTLSEKKAIQEARRCLRCDLTYLVDKFEVDTSVCNFCGRCFDACLYDALPIGPGYELAASERQKLLELDRGRNRWRNWVFTLLALAIAAIVLTIIVSKLASL